MTIITKSTTAKDNFPWIFHCGDIYKPVHKNIDHYTTTYMSTFFWNKSHILFAWYGITTVIKGWYMEHPVEIWCSEEMFFHSGD